MSDTKGTNRDILIEDEMRESYLTYAMSVIVSRALPDGRDGLKPVQRRLLVAMDELGLGPRAKHRKCGKIVGDTHGNYHPHGDMAIYDTLVRMAQPFRFRYPLVDSHGNFGSLDGDPPAAMRYTAARLSNVGAEILEDIKLDTVDFTDNYEGTRQEPVVLPGKFPNFLANGGSGIAVGMATSIPPHNISELCDGIIRYIDNPGLSIEEILEVIPGPDFPTGGQICGRAGIVDGYRTGRGTITIRARTRIETGKKGGGKIVISEPPFNTTRDNIVEKIADAVQAEKVENVSDIRNESDSSGTRIAIELKRGADPDVVLNQLFRSTPLQSTFSIILIGIINGRPVTLSIKELIQHYVEHRVEVLRRRTLHLLGKAEDRAHVLEGLRIALINIEDVIRIIRGSENTSDAQSQLMDTFSLTQRQADAILAMRLQSLVGLERIKIEQEYEELKEKISDYKRILADRAMILDIIREDLYEIKEKYGDERRTEITGPVAHLERADLIPEEDVVVTMSVRGYVKRTRLDTFKAQGRGGKGIVGADLQDEDAIANMFVSSTHDYIMFFTNFGLAYWLKVFQIPEMSRTSRGRALVNILSLDEGERITGLIPVREFDRDRFLVMATANGTVKKTTLDAFGKRKSGGIIAIDLVEGDELVSVRSTTGEDEMLLITKDGQSIRFLETDVRAMGRVSRGVRGIRLQEKDRVVDMAVVREDARLLTISRKGYGKRTEFGQYSTQRRGGRGVINIRTGSRNGPVVAAREVSEDDEIMVLTRQGKMIRIPANTISCIGRNTQGVRVVRLDEEDSVTGFARIVSGDDGTEDGEEGDEGTQKESSDN